MKSKRIKFLFYTDVHATCVAPRHRIDDYGKAVVAKLAEVYAMAESEGCEFVVMGGDMFNAHRLFSYELLNDMMDVLCGSRLATHAVVGQHDVHAYNPDTFRTSTLAFVEHHCDRFHVMWGKTEAVPGVVLHPSHVWDKVEDAMAEDTDSSKVNVLVAHHLLFNGKKMFETVPTASLGGGRYDLVLCGDLHTGFDTHEVGGTWFCNPGALARRSVDEIDRQVSVAVVEVEKGSIPLIEMRSLRSVRPGREVFGRDFIDGVARPAQHADPSAFVAGMEEFEATAVDVHELVQSVGRAQGIRKEVLEYLAGKRPSGQ